MIYIKKKLFIFPLYKFTVCVICSLRLIDNDFMHIQDVSNLLNNIKNYTEMMEE